MHSKNLFHRNAHVLSNIYYMQNIVSIAVCQVS